uniref:Ovule protein n=1 Tax=Bursaphelenchus xylophilus TaxID=6326 RepID=A0A1I7SPH1_BURXY
VQILMLEIHNFDSEGHVVIRKSTAKQLESCRTLNDPKIGSNDNVEQGEPSKGPQKMRQEQIDGADPKQNDDCSSMEED